MKRSIVLLALLLCAAAVLTVFCAERLNAEGTEVEVSRTVISGDPAAADGLRMVSSQIWQGNLSWETEFMANGEGKTNFRFVYDGRMERMFKSAFDALVTSEEQRELYNESYSSSYNLCKYAASALKELNEQVLGRALHDSEWQGYVAENGVYLAIGPQNYGIGLKPPTELTGVHYAPFTRGINGVRVIDKSGVRMLYPCDKLLLAGARFCKGLDEDELLLFANVDGAMTMMEFDAGTKKLRQSMALWNESVDLEEVVRGENCIVPVCMDGRFALLTRAAEGYEMEFDGELYDYYGNLTEKQGKGAMAYDGERLAVLVTKAPTGQNEELYLQLIDRTGICYVGVYSVSNNYDGMLEISWEDGE